MNRDDSVVFEIAFNYSISDSLVDCDGYSISSKGFLLTVVDIMVIWVKFIHSVLVHWFWKGWCSLMLSSVWPLPTWMGLGKFNSDDHYIYYCGQESLRRNGVASWSTKESEMQYLDAISKTTEWSVCFQGKPFNITVIQAYAPTSNAEEAELNGSMTTYKSF